MSYLTRIYVDGTGGMVAKRWRPGLAPVIATQLLALMTAHPDNQVPAESRTFFRRRQEDLEDALELYQSRSQDKPALTVLPEMSPELLAFATAEQLSSTPSVDSLIDLRWRQVDDISRGHAARIGNPLAVSAQRLQLRFFREGRGFVRLPYAQQFIENDARLRSLTPEEQEAAAAIGVADLIHELRLLNVYFGRILGLTEVSDPSERPETPEERSVRALERVLQATWAAVCAVWPGENSTHTEIRARLLAPIIKELKD